MQLAGVGDEEVDGQADERVLVIRPRRRLLRPRLLERAAPCGAAPAAGRSSAVRCPAAGGQAWSVPASPISDGGIANGRNIPPVGDSRGERFRWRPATEAT